MALDFSTLCRIFYIEKDKRNMWTKEQRERYNEARRIKRRLASRARKAERLKALQQMVEHQTYLNDSPESLEYYKILNPTNEVEVYEGGERKVFDTAKCAAKHYGVHINNVRLLINGKYSTTGKHFRGDLYFAPAGYYSWLGKQTIKIPNLEKEIELYLQRLKKGFDN